MFPSVRKASGPCPRLNVPSSPPCTVHLCHSPVCARLHTCVSMCVCVCTSRVRGLFRCSAGPHTDATLSSSLWTCDVSFRLSISFLHDSLRTFDSAIRILESVCSFLQTKSPAGIWIGISLNLQIHLRRTDGFTILSSILPCTFLLISLIVALNGAALHILCYHFGS